MADPDPIPFCLCIPARNEAQRLPICLDALANQYWPSPIQIIIAVNNSGDDSLAVIETARQHHGERLDLHVKEAIFPPDLAHAGSARRLAMDSGLALLPATGPALLISTDADTRPPPTWIANIQEAITHGATMVGGRIDIEEREPLPPAVQKLRALWDQYWHDVRIVEDSIDPLPWDPLPRHGDHTGASLAITAELYRACGGVPLLQSGEDVALVNAALAQGGRLAHPENVSTFVSPRLDGRASGGMAQAMQKLFGQAENGASLVAPHFDHWRARAAWRRDLRAQPHGAAIIAREEPLLPPMPADMPLQGTA